jgi:hypothetical protein
MEPSRVELGQVSDELDRDLALSAGQLSDAPKQLGVGEARGQRKHSVHVASPGVLAPERV